MPRSQTTKKSKSAKKSRSTTKPHSAHLTKLVAKDANFKTLVAKYGMPRGPKDCTELNPNDICMVTDCVDGKRIVMRCDGNGACTRYSEEPC